MSRRRPTRRTVLAVQPLEAREVPATLVSPTTMTYQDSDGDAVKVVFSKPILTQANVDDVFYFNGGLVDGNNQAKQQLWTIDVHNIAPNGTSITVTATPNPTNGGDGLAAVGEILANSADLGTVNIDGDLGRLVCGTANDARLALGAIVTHSIGRFGTATGAQELSFAVTGSVGSVTVKTDMKAAAFATMNQGRIGRINIGGSLSGDPLLGPAGFAALNFGSITIGGSATNVLIGASAPLGGPSTAGFVGTVKVGGDFDGQLIASKNLGALHVGGDFTGQVGALENLGTVQIGGDFKEGLIGSLRKTGGIGIGGDFRGLISSLGSCGPIRIGGDVIGGDADNTGEITVLGRVPSIVIGGDLQGGNHPGTGWIFAGRVGSMRIGGDVLGTSSSGTGYIGVTHLGSLTIDGSVKAGPSDGRALEYSGHISAGTIKRLTIKGDLATAPLLGGTALECGSIHAANSLGVVSIGRIVGTEESPARIAARGQDNPSAAKDLAIGSLTVAGDVEWAKIVAGEMHPNGLFGGTLSANADAQIGAVTVGGNWKGSALVAGITAGDDGYYGSGDPGEGKMTGGKDFATVQSRIGPVTIRGSVVPTESEDDGFAIMAETVTSVRIGGSVVALKAGNSNDDVLVAPGSDLYVVEI